MLASWMSSFHVAQIAALVAASGPAFSQNIRLNGPLVRSEPGGPIVGDVLAFQSAAAIGRVVYRADQDQDQLFELYSAPFEGTGRARRLAPTLAATGWVTPDFATSPDGAWVVFEHRAQVDQSRRLFAVATTGGGEPTLLDGPGDFELPFAFAAGSTHVVYRRLGAAPGAFDLCSVPLDGALPPITLHPAWPAIDAERSVVELELGPDGTEVLFRADHGATPGKMELYLVPVDGSAPPRRLGGEVGGSGGVLGFLPSPDGRNVLYRASTGGEEPKTHLYAAPLRGPGKPELLSAFPGPANAHVYAYQLTGDGRTVVFAAEKSPRRERLYSAPVETPPPHGLPGGTREPRRHGPVHLTPMPADHTVAGWQLSGDGTRVVYRAGDSFGGVTELFSVRTNGDGSPLRINRPLGPSERVSGFAIAPDGEHVVYMAGYGFGGDTELYRVPLDGGPSLDYGTLAVPSLVERFEIAPDSSFVFYQGYTRAFDALQMFAVPFDGSDTPRRLSSRAPPGGNVASDFLPLSRGRVLYRADQEADEVFQLYSGYFGHGHAAPR